MGSPLSGTFRRSAFRLSALSPAWLVLAMLCCGRASAARIDPVELTDAHVQSAIDALVEALYARRQPKRFWDPAPGGWTYKDHGQQSQVGGYTALATLALLYAGQSYQDPRLRDAVDHLADTTLDGTYAVAIRAHVWSLLPARFSKELQTDAQWLMQAFIERERGWGYEMKPRAAWYDNSLAQYGALGLWEAAKRDVNVPRRYWQMLEDRYLANQHADGGWNYKDAQPVTGSMTAAGLTVLFITQDLLHSQKAAELRRDGPTRAEQAIDRSLRWMDANFTADENPGKDAHFLYYLYGVERVGLASGYKTFGGKDWFRLGAAAIIERLCEFDAEAGAMRVHETMYGDGRRAKVTIDDLAFALMFLSRGRVPVAVNKLRVDGMRWNNRPRDVANLAAWIGQRSESALNWQIVDGAAAPRDWLDAPLLYLASDEALPEAMFEPIRDYLLMGGLLLAVQEGRGRAFASSIEKLGREMFPEFESKALSRDHWAYSLLEPVQRPGRPTLRAIGNGVRELIIFVPGGDVARSFQIRDEKAEDGFAAAMNVYLAASEMNRPRPRLHATAPLATSPVDDAALTIVRANPAGRAVPEPMALPILASHLHAEKNLAINVADHPVDAIHTMQPRPSLVVVSGVDAHVFTAAEIDAVRAYVEAGGTILFETAGGRGEFASQAEEAISTEFNLTAQSLMRSQIITGEKLAGAKNLSQIEYRPYSLEAFGSRETSPRLRGLIIDGQPRVLFSREDISNALLDQPCWGVSGYSTQSARDLMLNIILHSIREK